jgi:hypothetical protein
MGEGISVAKFEESGKKIYLSQITQISQIRIYNEIK